MVWLHPGFVKTMCAVAVEEFAVALLADELAHDLSAPASFFDTWLAALARGAPLEAEDLDIAREEGARLKTLLAELRALRAPPLEPRPLALAPLVSEALRAPTPAERELEVTCAIPEQVLVNIDLRVAQAVLRPMVSALARTVSERGSLRASLRQAGGPVLVITARSPTEPQALRWPPWLLSQPEERPLAVARKIARAHGWHMDFEEGDDSRSLTLAFCGRETRRAGYEDPHSR